MCAQTLAYIDKLFTENLQTIGIPYDIAIDYDKDVLVFNTIHLLGKYTFNCKASSLVWLKDFSSLLCELFDLPKGEIDFIKMLQVTWIKQEKILRYDNIVMKKEMSNFECEYFNFK